MTERTSAYGALLNRNPLERGWRWREIADTGESAINGFFNGELAAVAFRMSDGWYCWLIQTTPPMGPFKTVSLAMRHITEVHYRGITERHVDTPALDNVQPRQSVTFSCSDIWDAYKAGAQDARENGGNPSDEIIGKSCDAYVKLVYESNGGDINAVAGLVS